MNYLLQIISLKLKSQFLYLINSYLFLRCLEKVFEEERNGIEKEIAEVSQQVSDCRKKTGK